MIVITHKGVYTRVIRIYTQYMLQVRTYIRTYITTYTYLLVRKQLIILISIQIRLLLIVCKQINNHHTL